MTRKEPKTLERATAVLALIVSIGSALFSYVQSRTSATQLKLVEQQLRPHVSFVPVFFRTKSGLKIDMHLQNQSPLPANVLYTDLAGWVGGEFVSPNFTSAGPDIIYQEKGGLSSPPILSGIPLARIDRGDTLILTTCAVYGSTSKSDARRWRLQGIHEYVPGTSLATRLFIDEEMVAPSEVECSAKDVKTSHGYVFAE